MRTRWYLLRKQNVFFLLVGETWKISGKIWLCWLIHHPQFGGSSYFWGSSRLWTRSSSSCHVLTRDRPLKIFSMLRWKLNRVISRSSTQRRSAAFQFSELFSNSTRFYFKVHRSSFSDFSTKISNVSHLLISLNCRLVHSRCHEGDWNVTRWRRANSDLNFNISTEKARGEEEEGKNSM